MALTYTQNPLGWDISWGLDADHPLGSCALAVTGNGVLLHDVNAPPVHRLTMMTETLARLSDLLTAPVRIILPTPVSRSEIRFLAARGFQFNTHFVEVQRDLSVNDSPIKSEIRLRPTAQHPETTRFLIKETLVGLPLFHGLNATEILLDLQIRADENPQNSLWKIAIFHETPVGFILPSYDEVGFFMGLGVLPAERGKGYAKALFGLGLALLAEASVAKFCDDIDKTEHAMLHIASHFGCQQGQQFKSFVRRTSGFT